MEELRQAELRRMQGKLQSLSAEQRSVVEALTRGLINKVLHQPLQAMKTAARNGDLTVVEAVQQIFGLSSQGGGLTSQGMGLSETASADSSYSAERFSTASSPRPETSRDSVTPQADGSAVSSRTEEPVDKTPSLEAARR
jgi:hypothetical protein